MTDPATLAARHFAAARAAYDAAERVAALADEQLDQAGYVYSDATKALKDAAPTTMAGAIELLDVLVNKWEFSRDEDECSAILRNVLEFLKGT